MARIIGKVLDVENVSGGQGENAYHYTAVFVLDGRDVVRGRLADNFGPLPSKDDEVELEAYPRAYVNRDKVPTIAWTFVRQVPAYASPL